MIGPDDDRHGTTRGHAAGCRETCCREARNLDERRRRKHRQALGIQRRIDGTGTHRRIQALWAIGWTSQHIAQACGWTTPQAVTEIIAVRANVYIATARAIATAYDRMSMTPGPSTQNRRRAAKKGWASPLCWDNIDDPNETPAGLRSRSDCDYDSQHILDEATVIRVLAGENLPTNRAEKTETMRRWIAAGRSERSLCERMGWRDGRYTTRDQEAS